MFKLDKNKTVTEELERVTSERDELQQEIQDECMSKKKLEIDLQAVRGELAGSQEQLDRQMNQNQTDAHALATLQHQQTLLHDENSQLLAEIAQLKAAERSGGSAGTDALAQIQRLKGEKKQLKAYAISLKGQLESSEKEKKTSLSESNYQLAQSLVQRMTPLLATLEAEVSDLQSLRDQYVSSGGARAKRSDKETETETEAETKKKRNAAEEEEEEGLQSDLMTRTTSAVQSGLDTVDTVSVMLEYADMKLAAIESTTTTTSSPSSTESTPVKSKKSSSTVTAIPEHVPEHTGSVYAPLVSVSPPPTNHSGTNSAPSPTKSPTSPSNGHPATCNCMKCKAPPKRPSMMEAVINTFLEVEENVDKRLSSKNSKSTHEEKL